MTTPTRTRPVNPAASVSTVLPPGRVVAVSMIAGGGSAAALVFAVLPSAAESTIVGASLGAFALGWAMLAWLTTRLTAFPQQWAYVPAAVLATASVVLLVLRPGEPAMTQLAWVWAPLLLTLGLFVARRTRQNLPGAPAFIVYPVAMAMLLAGLGALFQAMTPDPAVLAGTMPGRLIDVGGYRLQRDPQPHSDPRMRLTLRGKPPDQCPVLQGDHSPIVVECSLFTGEIGQFSTGADRIL